MGWRESRVGGVRSPVRVGFVSLPICGLASSLTLSRTPGLGLRRREDAFGGWQKVVRGRSQKSYLAPGRQFRRQTAGGGGWVGGGARHATRGPLSFSTSLSHSLLNARKAERLHPLLPQSV